MRLTYVLITHNRCHRLLQTLRKLIENTGLPREAWEAIVVDNASTDGTFAAVRTQFPDVKVITLEENEGMPARNHAFPRARGRYIVLLDDDSYPLEGAIPAALNYLARRTKVAALVARVVLPNGETEAPAFPNVLLGGASILRRSVLEEVGGFAPEFFRQAEEYDLSFRIWQAGYAIQRFEDILFRHEKDAGGGRSSALTQRMDLRNNLILVERYLPRELRRAYRRDWLQRYARFALHDGNKEAVESGLREARVWGRREAAVGRRTLDSMTVEHLFDLKRQAMVVAKWQRENKVRRVVLVDFSKNLFATWRACQAASMESVALADDRPAFEGRRYRGVPIFDIPTAVGLAPDGAVITNINPGQIDARERAVRRAFRGPVLRLWEPAYLNPSREAKSDAA